MMGTVSNNDGDTFNKLVELIYEAALEPALWQQALVEMARHVGLGIGHLLALETQMGSGILNGITAQMLSGNASLYRNPLWNLPAQPDPPASFSPKLARLLPHVNRAFRLMERGQGNAQAEEIASAALNATPLAAMVLDRCCCVLHCNRRGEKLLNAGNVLRLRENKLMCADGHPAMSLVAAVDTTAKTGRNVNLLVRHVGNTNERYSVTLTSLTQRGILVKVNEPGNILCLVAPLDRRRIATARQLIQLFGLSSAEARLARALALGESLEDYARANGLQLPTIKTQLRAIFAKTGTDRQAMLIRVLLGIPAVREHIM